LGQFETKSQKTAECFYIRPIRVEWLTSDFRPAVKKLQATHLPLQPHPPTVIPTDLLHWPTRWSPTLLRQGYGEAGDALR
jgi:hypothetical protein